MNKRYYPFVFLFLAILASSILLAVILFRGHSDTFWTILLTLLTLEALISVLGSIWLIHRESRRVVRSLTVALRRAERQGDEQVDTSTLAGLPLPPDVRREMQQYVQRVRESYQIGRQFTQNASHELQTPLAIIKGNAELLLQSDNLEEKESEALGSILQNATRLAKLNSALILMSKIEKRRFADETITDIRQVTEEVLANFEDLIEAHGISVSRDFRDRPVARLSATLAEILIANLVQNAIRHNNGHPPTIEIRLEKKRLTITNPGRPLGVPADTLFRRFQRYSDTEESLGLGLSIVKRICDRYGFTIRYTNDGPLHTIQIDFGAEHEN